MPTLQEDTCLVTKILDLSATDFSQYPKGVRLQLNPFRVDDVLIKFHLYLNGNNLAVENYCSMAMHAYGKGHNDNRKVMFEAQCDSRILRSSFIELSNHGSGRKFTNLFPTELIKSSKITLTVILKHDPLFVAKKPDRTFATQLSIMYSYSKTMGDITLIVKKPPKDDMESHDLYVPSRKKQRTNHNNSALTQPNKLKASAVILRSASQVFDRMLDPKNNMREYQTKQIVIHAYSVKHVRCMLYFINTNKLPEDCDALYVLQLAHFFKLDRLFWECVRTLIKNVTVSNFVSTIHTFDRFEISKGYNSLIDFGKKNIAELQKVDDFLLLSHSFRCGILLLNS